MSEITYEEQVDNMGLQELLEEVIDMRVNHQYPGGIDHLRYISEHVSERLFEIVIEQNLSPEEVKMAKRIWGHLQ